jgi:hypothetical protein
MAFSYSLWQFVFFYVLVCMDQEKSGNPDETLDALEMISKIKSIFCFAPVLETRPSTTRTSWAPPPR